MTEGHVKDRYDASSDAATQIVTAGYARRRLGPHERAALECLRSIAGRFFARDPEWKHRFCGGATGYQPYGTRWADPDTDDPARRDGCERLDNWSGHRIPGVGRMPTLQVALNWWQRMAARTAGQVLDGIAAHYAYERTWDFRPTSWLEASWYPDRSDGIAPHTDGHLITVLAADGPGLEADTGTGMAPLWGGPGELVILPGELMSAMTAGQIPPLNHQVAGDHRPGRLSVMYFVNPPFRGQVAPYAGGRADIADLALTRCTMFGQQVPADLLP
jgi:isopenicillin N synthase-like dioxygenase